MKVITFISQVIGKEKGGEGSSRSRGRSGSTSCHRSSSRDDQSRDDRGEKSKSANQNFAPHVKDLIQVKIISGHGQSVTFSLQTIDQLRKNMILGLEKDANFKFEKDWEFFTNMFKKQVHSEFPNNSSN